MLVFGGHSRFSVQLIRNLQSKNTKQKKTPSCILYHKNRNTFNIKITFIQLGGGFENGGWGNTSNILFHKKDFFNDEETIENKILRKFKMN